MGYHRGRRFPGFPARMAARIAAAPPVRVRPELRSCQKAALSRRCRSTHFRHCICQWNVKGLDSAQWSRTTAAASSATDDLLHLVRSGNRVYGLAGTTGQCCGAVRGRRGGSSVGTACRTPTSMPTQGLLTAAAGAGTLLVRQAICSSRASANAGQIFLRCLTDIAFPSRLPA
jgi:hypothetical protein